MNARLPWFPLYVSDWLLSHTVRLMTPEQRGIYIQLLCEQWQNGGVLPGDEAQLQALAGATVEQWSRSRDVVLKKFERSDGAIFNTRLRQEMEGRESWHSKLSEAGKRGMANRWGAKQKRSAQDPPDASADHDSLTAPLMEVWQSYIQQTERNPKTYSLTSVRKRKGLARLRECLMKTGGDVARAVELMKVAVRNLAASDFHMGRDAKTGGKKYCDWEAHLFKSYEQMEKWWNQ